jgi:hypothetical protein
VEIVTRPAPPTDLTGEQGDEWRAVVNRMPADWFQRETHALLSQYCRHVVSARRISQLIDQMLKPADEGETDPFNFEDYDRLIKMQEREGRALSSLATRMRLTQQTTYDKSKKKPAGGRKPWEAPSR